MPIKLCVGDFNQKKKMYVTVCKCVCAHACVGEENYKIAFRDNGAHWHIPVHFLSCRMCLFSR